MKSLSVALAAHYQGDMTTLATCWKCTLKSGVILGFTNATMDLVISGVTYAASTGFTPSDIQTSDKFNVDNLEVNGAIDSSVIREVDLRTGLWDYAAIFIFEVNYRDLSMGINPLRSGTLGQVSTKRNAFVAELRGLFQALQQPVGRALGYECDANFGDTRCTKNIASYSSTGSVLSVTDGRNFAVTLANSTFLYTDGKLTMTSGPASGFSSAIREYIAPNWIVLQTILPYTPVTGNTFAVSAGCNKTKETCADVYNNIVNHRGFPTLPGKDAMLAGTGSA